MDIASPSLNVSYYDNCSNNSFRSRTQESFDDRSMQRRNPVRRQRNVLDDDQTKDAIKLLEKYVRRKYRNSLFLSQDAGDIDQAATPTGHTQSACQWPRQATNPAERLSNIFNSTQLGPVASSDHHYPPASPAFPVNQEPSFRSEIKFKEEETWWSWISRIVKFCYYELGFQYIVLAAIMIIYACIGGYMFMILEYENQQIEINMQNENLYNESLSAAEELFEKMRVKGCGNSALTKDCYDLIRKSFIERAELVEHKVRGTPWTWDFWNSVFFAATIFTTIGYGNLACKTNVGRIATIIYGLIGIPLGLAVLKKYGEFSIHQAQKIRFLIKRQFRKCSFKKQKQTETKLKRTDTIESITSDEVKETLESTDEISSFPLRWALLLVFLFIFICSFIVSFWEKWDFLTAVYFFFVSLSTIGFGDVIPEHPRTACGLFILYFVGLALFSMVYAILQERVENRYMWALELIDLEYQENQKYELERMECEAEAEGSSYKTVNGIERPNTLQPSVRWRAKTAANSIEYMPDRPESERRFSVFTPGEPPQFAPPVLGALLMHNVSMKKKLLARSESILNKQGTKRPNSLFPSNEMLSTPANSSRGGSPWLLHCEINHPKEPTALGKSSGLSAPNLAGGNRSPSGALSVITEASDEDTRHTKMNVLNVRKYLPKSQKEMISQTASRESLDQILEELQLEPQDQSTTPKPYRFRKNRDTATPSEKTPLSPKDTLEEEDETSSE